MRLFGSVGVGNNVRVGVSTGGGGSSGPDCLSYLLGFGFVCGLVGFVIPYALIGLVVAIMVGGVVWGLTPTRWEAELRADAERRATTRDLREAHPPT